MATLNKQVVLKSRPSGWVSLDNFEIRDVDMSEPDEGDVLVRTLYMSLDPYMRGRMDDRKSYAQNFSVGEPLKARIVGQVVASKHQAFEADDLVFGTLDWAEYSLVPDAKGLRHLDADLAPLPFYLGALGMPGMTAWIGMQIGAPKAGDTLFVSAASGAVGQIVGQIGKLAGCYVVGSAGTDAKVSYLTDDLGFDAAFNYKSVPDILSALEAAAPEGVDIYFDNVGGLVLEAALDHANTGARFVECGMISQYNQTREETTGVRNLTHINRKRIRMQGFIVSDHSDRLGDFMTEMAAWLRSGAIKYRIDEAAGLENAPKVFIAMMKGENFGKQVVRVGDLK